MAKRSIKARLYDINHAIAGIRQTLDGQTLDSFLASWSLQRATERGLEIISEASRSIPADIKAQETGIPWPKIAAVGNMLRHEYQNIDATVIWNIAQNDLDMLEEAARRLFDIAD